MIRRSLWHFGGQGGGSMCCTSGLPKGNVVVVDLVLDRSCLEASEPSHVFWLLWGSSLACQGTSSAPFCFLFPIPIVRMLWNRQFQFGDEASSNSGVWPLSCGQNSRVLVVESGG